MGLNFLKQTGTIFFKFKLLYLILKKKKKPLKKKTKGLKKICGRNNQGIITVRHQGGGNKKSYRDIDFFSPFFSPLEFSIIIEQLEYDPNRNTILARMFCPVSKARFYFIASSNMEIGCLLQKKDFYSQQIGFLSRLINIPLGTLVSCIGTHFRIFQGILQRAAGTFGQLVQKGESDCTIRLSSGKIYILLSITCAILGAVANSTFLRSNAGHNRRKNIRPTTRGVAMNSIDHPHGGGEGKSSPGRPSVNLWGKPAHGKKKISK